MRERYTRIIKMVLTRGILIAALLFALLYVPGAREPLARTGAALAAPFWGAYQYVRDTVAGMTVAFSEKKELAAENKALRGLLSAAHLRLIQTNVLMKENEELKQLLNRHETSGGTLGVVLSRPQYSPYDTFMIDIGRQHAILVGHTVFAGEALVGIVDAVYEKTARVKLFSSPGTETEVLLGLESTPALARGLGGGAFQVKLPRDIAIREGDAVFHSVLSNTLVGIVREIKSKEANPLQTILFNAPLNIWETRFVIVTPQFLFSFEEITSNR